MPDKKCFYSSVKDGTIGDNGKKLDGHISDEDYSMCKEIWNEFNMKNMGDYHYHYLNKDVLLLADVFEKYIDTCLKFYRLDSSHYFSSPRLSWNAMLKIASVKFEKIFERREKGFLTLLRNTVKQITNIWKVMILQNRQNTYRALI